MWVSDSHHLAILGNPHGNDHKKVSGLGRFLVIVDVNVAYPNKSKKLLLQLFSFVHYFLAY